MQIVKESCSELNICNSHISKTCQEAVPVWTVSCFVCPSRRIWIYDLYHLYTNLPIMKKNLHLRPYGFYFTCAAVESHVNDTCFRPWRSMNFLTHTIQSLISFKVELSCTMNWIIVRFARFQLEHIQAYVSYREKDLSTYQGSTEQICCIDQLHSTMLNVLFFLYLSYIRVFPLISIQETGFPIYLFNFDYNIIDTYTLNCLTARTLLGSGLKQNLNAKYKHYVGIW